MHRHTKIIADVYKDLNVCNLTLNLRDEQRNKIKYIMTRGAEDRMVAARTFYKEAAVHFLFFLTLIYIIVFIHICN